MWILIRVEAIYVYWELLLNMLTYLNILKPVMPVSRPRADGRGRGKGEVSGHYIK